MPRQLGIGFSSNLCDSNTAHSDGLTEGDAAFVNSLNSGSGFVMSQIVSNPLLEILDNSHAQVSAPNSLTGLNNGRVLNIDSLTRADINSNAL